MDRSPLGSPTRPATGLTRRRQVAGCVLTAIALMATVGCSSSSPSAAAAGLPAGTKVLHIVAGENFWGSIVGQLAGKVGDVTSIVSDPNADPHNYEASASDARAFASADYAVLNGAGYDAWAQQLLSGNPNSKRKVLIVANLLGKKEGDNPHFWYNPDYVTTVTDQIEADLKSLDPAASAYLDAQRAAFDTATIPYRNRLAAIKAMYAGTPVAATESIFVYLGDYLDLDVISPPAFMEAVAEGNDPPAPAAAQFQNEILQKEAKVLVYNEQTATAETTNIKNLAAEKDIPTIGITETVQPPSESYEQWFANELQQLQNALALSGAHSTTTSSS